MRQPRVSHLLRGEGASAARLKRVASRDNSPACLGLGRSLAAESIALATSTTESTQADAEGNGASTPSITQAMTTRRRRKTNREDNAICRVLFTWRDRATRRCPETTVSRCSVRFAARDTGVRNFLIHAECCAMRCSLLAAPSLAGALTTSVGVADERAARIDALTGLGPSAALAGELEGLRKMLQLLADNPPSGDYPKWSSIAQAGADAARYEDIKGVKKSCKDCHDAYKERFKRQFPRTSAHPKEKDHWLPLAAK
jgi:hypothetical protein